MTAIEFQHQLIGLQEQLKYFAHSLTSNEEEAKDLIQDTNIKILSNREKFKPETNFKAWTYTIMKNTFINNYRKRSKSKTIFDSTDNLYYINHSQKNKNTSPDDNLITEVIYKNIKELDTDQRIPFEMHYEGYKYKEIADRLKLSIGTVKSRIFFTRKKLMSKLKYA